MYTMPAKGDARELAAEQSWAADLQAELLVARWWSCMRQGEEGKERLTMWLVQAPQSAHCT